MTENINDVLFDVASAGITDYTPEFISLKAEDGKIIPANETDEGTVFKYASIYTTKALSMMTDITTAVGDEDSSGPREIDYLMQFDSPSKIKDRLDALIEDNENQIDTLLVTQEIKAMARNFQVLDLGIIRITNPDPSRLAKTMVVFCSADELEAMTQKLVDYWAFQFGEGEDDED